MKPDVPPQGRRLMETAQAGSGPCEQATPDLPASLVATDKGREAPGTSKGTCLSWTPAERNMQKHFDETLTSYTKDTSLSTWSESSAQISRKPLRR